MPERATGPPQGRTGPLCAIGPPQGRRAACFALGPPQGRASATGPPCIATGRRRAAGPRQGRASARVCARAAAGPPLRAAGPRQGVACATLATAIPAAAVRYKPRRRRPDWRGAGTNRPAAVRPRIRAVRAHWYKPRAAARHGTNRAARPRRDGPGPRWSTVAARGTNRRAAAGGPGPDPGRRGSTSGPIGFKIAPDSLNLTPVRSIGGPPSDLSGGGSDLSGGTPVGSIGMDFFRACGGYQAGLFSFLIGNPPTGAFRASSSRDCVFAAG